MKEGWRGNGGGWRGDGGGWREDRGELEGADGGKNGGGGLVSKAPTPSIRHLLSEASSTVPGPQWSMGTLCNSVSYSHPNQ